MTSHMPKDDHNNPIPVLRYKQGGAHNQAVTTGAASLIAFAAGTEIVSFWSEGLVKIEFGDATVVADVNSHAWPAGAVDTTNLTDANGDVLYTHMSVIAVGADTIFHVSEKE